MSSSGDVSHFEHETMLADEQESKSSSHTWARGWWTDTREHLHHNRVKAQIMADQRSLRQSMLPSHRVARVPSLQNVVDAQERKLFQYPSLTSLVSISEKHM